MKDKLSKKVIIRRIIFIIIFLIVAVGITYYLISKNTQNVENITFEKKEKIPAEKTINLNETYNINDLKVKTYEEKYKDIDLQYYQIDGLKNLSIETEINYNLKKDVQIAIDEALDTDRVKKDTVSIYAHFASNFANTLSIYYNISAYDDEAHDFKELFNKNVLENYDLTTGDKIKLNDIFTKDANVGKIISDKIYNDVIKTTSDIEYDEENGLGKIKNYNDIEEEIFKLVNDYNNKRDIDFCFDEKMITLLDYNSNIMYMDNLDSITIYDKYKTDESIFDGTYDNLKDLPNLVKRKIADYTILEQGENYYIDISLFDCYLEEERSEKVFEAAKKVVDEYVKEVKEEAKTSDKFIVINRAYNCNSMGTYDELYEEWIPNGKYELSIGVYRFEVTKELFENEVYNKIIEIFRDYPDYELSEDYCMDNMFGMYLMYEDGTDKEYLKNLEQDLWAENIYFDSDGNIIDKPDEDTIIWDVND